jgi:multidrug resistance efflux pump
VVVTEAYAKVQQAQAALAKLLHPATASAIAAAQAQVQSAQAELDLLKAGARPQEIDAAAAAVAEAEATLRRAEADLATTQLRAPFSGTVTTLSANLGEMVQSGQVVVVLADLSHMQVETTDLSERDVVRVKVGQPATVFVGGTAGHGLCGRPQRRDSGSRDASGGRSHCDWR